MSRVRVSVSRTVTVQMSSPQVRSINLSLPLSIADLGCSTAVFATLLLLSAQQLLSCCQRLFRSVVGMELFARIRTHTHTQASTRTHSHRVMRRSVDVVKNVDKCLTFC